MENWLEVVCFKQQCIPDCRWIICTFTYKQARPRRSNGAILSRRQSGTTHGQSSQYDSTIQPPIAESQAPQPQDPQPQTNPHSEASADTRYSKEMLLDIYKTLPSSDAVKSDVSRLFSEAWNPGHANGTLRGWGKTHDGRENIGPYICWESSGSVQPISFEEMTEEERNACAPTI